MGATMAPKVEHAQLGVLDKTARVSESWYPPHAWDIRGAALWWYHYSYCCCCFSR